MKEYKVPVQSLIDHIKTAIDVDDWDKEMAEDLLKEQEEQKQKWLKQIAYAQLAVCPTGNETEEELAKLTGEWNGLQMAFDILTNGR